MRRCASVTAQSRLLTVTGMTQFRPLRAARESHRNRKCLICKALWFALIFFPQLSEMAQALLFLIATQGAGAHRTGPIGL
jgi:hypothetical protein